eukprot:487572_1
MPVEILDVLYLFYQHSVNKKCTSHTKEMLVSNDGKTLKNLTNRSIGYFDVPISGHFANISALTISINKLASTRFMKQKNKIIFGIQKVSEKDKFPKGFYGFDNFGAHYKQGKRTFPKNVFPFVELNSIMIEYNEGEGSLQWIVINQHQNCSKIIEINANDIYQFAIIIDGKNNEVSLTKYEYGVEHRSYIDKFKKPDHMDDVIIVSAVNEKNETIPVLTIPEAIPNEWKFDPVNFAANILQAKYVNRPPQLCCINTPDRQHLEEIDNTLSENIYTFLYAYSHYIWIADFNALRYMRPLCLSYITLIPKKLHKIFSQMKEKFTLSGIILKKAAQNTFLQDIDHFETLMMCDSYIEQQTKQHVLNEIAKIRILFGEKLTIDNYNTKHCIVDDVFELSSIKRSRKSLPQIIGTHKWNEFRESMQSNHIEFKNNALEIYVNAYNKQIQQLDKNRLFNIGSFSSLDILPGHFLSDTWKGKCNHNHEQYLSNMINNCSSISRKIETDSKLENADVWQKFIMDRNDDTDFTVQIEKQKPKKNAKEKKSHQTKKYMPKIHKHNDIVSQKTRQTNLGRILLGRFKNSAEEILFSIFSNRPLIILANDTNHSTINRIKKAVKALSLLVNENETQEWRNQPLHSDEMSSLKIVGMSAEQLQNSSDDVLDLVTIIQFDESIVYAPIYRYEDKKKAWLSIMSVNRKRFKTPTIFCRQLSCRLLEMSLHVLLFCYIAQITELEDEHIHLNLPYLSALLETVAFTQSSDVDIAKNWALKMQNQALTLLKKQTM